MFQRWLLFIRNSLLLITLFLFFFFILSDTFLLFTCTHIHTHIHTHAYTHRHTHTHTHVAYWPSTELSIKRCTCVNSQWVRSKISGYHLEFGAIATLTGSRWMSNNCHVVYHWEERNKEVPIPLRVNRPLKTDR